MIKKNVGSGRRSDGRIITFDLGFFATGINKRNIII